MRCGRTYQLSWLLAFFLIVLSFCFVTRPLRAEEVSSEQSITGEVEPKEPLPSEPRVYADERVRGEDRLTMIGNVDLSYTLSKEGSSSLSGGSINGLLAPRYRFSDTLSFTFMYDGTYYKRLDFYSDAVGPKERTEFQRHTITPMFRINFGDNARYSISPFFFYTRTYNKDVEGGDWDDGLYNYRDTGGGLDFTMGQLGFGGADDGSLRLGVQYYERDYPNYVSLLDLAAGLGIERDEKDYHGVIARAQYNWINNSGGSWSAGYALLCKRLDDKKVVDSNGVLSSDKQHDYLHSLDLRFWYMPEVEGWLVLGVDLNGSLNRTNQNYYDGMGTISLEDDVFLDDYYSYNSYRIRPNMSYTFALFPLTPSFSYSYQRLDYRGRKAQSGDGTYKDDKQYEVQQVIALGLRYQLFQNCSVYAQWQHIAVRSNNDDESVYRYDHTVDNYYAGMSFRF